MGIVTWEGRPIEDLTKEELIKALERMVNQVNTMSREHTEALDLFCAIPPPREEHWLDRLIGLRK